MFTNAGKDFVLTNGITEAVSIGFSSNGTAEQAAVGGYRRGSWAPVAGDIEDGVVTLGSPVTMYAATAGAVAPTHLALFSANSGGDQLTTWQALSGSPPVPAAGQVVRITSLTLTT